MDKVNENTEFHKKVNDLIAAGLKVLPMDKDKRLIRGATAEKQLIRPIHSENYNFYFPDAVNVAIILDGMVCLDFELPFIQSGQYDEFEQTVKYLHSEIYDKVVIERSKSGGYHWYWSCMKSTAKKRLAQRQSTAVEVAAGDKTILLIEVLGQNKTAVCYPSPGTEQIRGDLCFIEELEPEENDILLNLAKQYDEFDFKPDPQPVTKKEQTDQKAPWNVFNEKHGFEWVRETLEDIGFTIVRDLPDKLVVKRPGNTSKQSSGSIFKENGMLYLFSSSTIFPSDKPLSPFDILKFLKYDDNFVECCNDLVKQGYGEFHRDSKEAISFFDITKTKKAPIISLNHVRFIDFFRCKGVGLLFIENSYVYIQIDGYLIREVIPEQLKKIAIAHINELPETFDCGITRTDLLEHLFKGVESYFSRNKLELLPRVEPDYLKDTKDVCYKPFKNGIVCITAEGAVLKSYEQVGKHLWAKHVIDFEIELINYETMTGDWIDFLACINSTEAPDNWSRDEGLSFEYLLRMTGYLLHGYKDPGRPFSAILAEAVETEEKGGGTGKGLYCQGLAKLTSVCQIAGKGFDPLARFAWQRAELHHKIMIVDDVQKNFRLESLYNAITEGITIERKNQQEIFIPYENSPKIIVVSNYVIGSDGNHAARRQRVFEFSPFFGPQYTPEKHFGHLLFNDWDNDEWNRFYNTQIGCIVEYLINGLQDRVKSEVLKRREVSQRFGKDFAEWFYEHYLKNGCEEWTPVTALYDHFRTYSDLEKSDYSMVRFKAATLAATLPYPGRTVTDRRLVEPQQGQSKERKVCMRVEKE